MWQWPKILPLWWWANISKGSGTSWKSSFRPELGWVCQVYRLLSCFLQGKQIVNKTEKPSSLQAPQSSKIASPKRPQWILNASLIRPQIIPKASLMRPQRVPNASPMRSQCVLKASPMCPQCVPNASLMRPQCVSTASLIVLRTWSDWKEMLW